MANPFNRNPDPAKEAAFRAARDAAIQSFKAKWPEAVQKGIACYSLAAEAEVRGVPCRITLEGGLDRPWYGRAIAAVSYEDRSIAKDAGFQWVPGTGWTIKIDL